MPSLDFTEKSVKSKITHLKKALVIYNLFGMTESSKNVESSIAFFTANVNLQATKNGDISLSTMLQNLRNTYESSIRTEGPNSIVTISAGMCYGMALWENGTHIEGERLITKLSTTSRRVLGPDHKITIESDQLLKDCKARYVIELPEMDYIFQALRYENDGQICVVTGPVTKPRIKGEERIHRIVNSCALPSTGCPVVCHGLVSASHLNGELGVVKTIKENAHGIRLVVHFEKKGTKPSLVKPENLRIAFELPIISEE